MKTRHRHPRGVVLAVILVAVPAAAQPAAPERDVPPAPPVEALVAEALERAPSLAAARARLAAAREMIAPAGALPNPMVELALTDVALPALHGRQRGDVDARPGGAAGVPEPGQAPGRPRRPAGGG